MHVNQSRDKLRAAVNDLMVRGPASTRALFAEDDIWQARIFGYHVAESWLRELLTPDQEPPRPGTLWRPNRDNQ